MDEEVVEAVESQEEAPQENKPSNQESDQSKNWREVNRVLAEQREEIRALRNELVKAPVSQETEEHLDPDDLMTVSQAEKLYEKKAKKLIAQELSARDSHNSEQLFMARNPDYEDTIKKYLPDLISENPHLTEALKSHPKPYELAYNTIKQSWKYRSEQAPMSPQAKKILKNVSTPASGNAATGTLKSKVESFTGLSRDQVWEMNQKHMMEGGR